MNEYITLQAQREIGVQILFAFAAFNNITVKGEGNAITTFSSIHSFLTHCANVSKLLWSPSSGRGPTIKGETGQNLADIISAPDLPLLRDCSFRNDLDHYDERLVSWIKEEYPKHKKADPNRRPVSDLTIGDKNHIGGSNTLHLRNYNPKTKIYTYAERELNIEKLRAELVKLQEFIGGPKVQELDKLV